MNLILDANISRRLIPLLATFADSIEHVSVIGINPTDREIWDYAIAHNKVIVTKDNDFDHLAFLLAPPGKVIRITLGNCTTESIAILMRTEVNRIELFAKNQEESLLTIP
ncbi:hypothetical protein C0431_08645 [bacterium]|nr:hypothetical protein [bacterium]